MKDEGTEAPPVLIDPTLRPSSFRPSAQLSIAAGSVVGLDHLRAGRNGHDAWHCEQRGDVTVAVVCDGCGSAPHSEIGAKIGAAIVARELLVHRWQHAAARAATRLHRIATSFGGDPARTIHDSFLFTVVAAVITPRETLVLSLGDGVYAVNGEVTVIGPFPDNAPPYLGYAMLDATQPRFTLEARIATSELRHLAIGTDGVLPLAEELRELAADDRWYRNPDAVRRRLFLLKPHDDATLVAIRRGEG